METIRYLIPTRQEEPGISQTPKPKETLEAVVQKADNGRTFTSNEVTEIILMADSLHLKDKLGSGKDLFASLEEKEENKPKAYSQQQLFALADRYGIPADYVNQAIEASVIPIEKQIEDINLCGVQETYKVFKTSNRMIARRFAETLCKSLTDRLYGEFSYKVTYPIFSVMGAKAAHIMVSEIKTVSCKSIFGKKKEKKVANKIIDVNVDNNYIINGPRFLDAKVVLLSPFALHACSNDIKDFKKYCFGLKVVRDYSLTNE